MPRGALRDKSGTLTRAGQKLAAVMLDPTYASATDEERARAAGISRRHLYRLMADEDFQAALRARAIDLLRPKLGPILDAAVQTASTPGRDGFKDREMLLQMVGLYVPKQALEHTGAEGGPIQVVVASGLNPRVYGHGDNEAVEADAEAGAVPER